MKVIFAGFCKTGTKSMAAALRELGYSVYDWPEQNEYHGSDWTRILTDGGTTEDFRRMYENVEAVTDIPASYFWDEIHKAFPDAKIIFSMRKDEDTWMESMRRQWDAEDQWYFRLFPYLSPTNYRRVKTSNIVIRAVLGCEAKQNLFKMQPFPEILVRMTYRRHNANVMQNAPKDKLLIHSPKDGWESLCKFLGKEVPDKPYPHKNVGGNIMEETYNTDPTFQRIKRESLATISIVTLLLAYGGYRLATGSNPIAYAKNCFITLTSRYSEVQ